jgi:hypothetical protein
MSKVVASIVAFQALVRAASGISVIGNPDPRGAGRAAITILTDFLLALCERDHSSSEKSMFDATRSRTVSLG